MLKDERIKYSKAAYKGYHIIQPADLLSYINSSECVIFTVLNTKNNRHYTYKIMKSSDVYLLVGEDNTKDYNMIGHIKIATTDDKYHTSGKTYFYKLATANEFQHSRSTRAIFYILKMARLKRDHIHLIILRYAECNICGRLLTHPLSIMKEKGPICSLH